MISSNIAKGEGRRAESSELRAPAYAKATAGKAGLRAEDPDEYFSFFGI